MKRIIFLLLVVPGLCFGAFTEFYMTSGGANINAGSTTGNTAVYTSTNGNWSTATRIFTPTDGSTPASTVSVGDFASIYVDGATTAVYIVRITAVAAGVNGAITTSASVLYGTAPSTSATGRSIKVGGAWLGPNGASTFPFGLSGSMGTLLNTSSDPVRVNAKNDQTYSVTVGLNLGALGAATLQGYSSSPGDLGKATFSSNLTTATNFTCTGSASQNFVDLIFVNTGASNTNNLVQTGLSTFWLRCVFHGARGSGFVNASGGTCYLIESEAYDCNQSNSVNHAGFNAASSVSNIVCINCYSHDHSGSNSSGFVASNASSLILINCISESNAGFGLLYGAATSQAGATLISVNSNYYNNTSDAIKLTNTTVGNWVYITNNNFVKNGGKGINNTVTSQTGVIYNNGRGAGTQANGSSDALAAIINTSTDVTFANNVTPWFAPTTGDFRTSLPAAMGAGRGAFTQTDGTNSGTAGYPDIGAAQHDDTCDGLGPCQTSGASAH